MLRGSTRESATRWISELIRSSDRAAETISVVRVDNSYESGHSGCEENADLVALPQGGSEPKTVNGAVGTVQAHNAEAPLISELPCCLAARKAAVRCTRTP